jgi:hypothetical protein
MVPKMIDGTFRQTNLPNESPEYLLKREELRKAEIELMRQRERVRFLLARVRARCAIFTVVIHGWVKTSKSAASTS